MQHISPPSLPGAQNPSGGNLRYMEYYDQGESQGTTWKRTSISWVAVGGRKINNWSNGQEQELGGFRVTDDK